MIVGVDTNTKDIGSEKISVTGIVHCVVKPMPEPNSYRAEFPWHEVILFRNCPSELHPEKFGWMSWIQRINHEPLNKLKRFALLTDRDLDNHPKYNNQKIPIFGQFYLPKNFTLIYGKSDLPNESLLNHLVVKCHKQADKALNMIRETGCYQYGNIKKSIRNPRTYITHSVRTSSLWILFRSIHQQVSGNE
jgi:hypothetical protein